MCRATMVATMTATIIGGAIWKPLLVSSSTRTRPDSGACMPAPIMAAAPTIAYAPAGEPGQSMDHRTPSPPPSMAPVLITGVNRPPEPPLPSEISVTKGLSANSASSTPHPSTLVNASCAMSLPLPNSCG